MIWTVWVVSHYLSTKVCTRLALANLSNSKWIIGSKPTARIWALVSTVRKLYHVVTQLVLPLLENGEKVYKRMKKGVRFAFR